MLDIMPRDPSHNNSLIEATDPTADDVWMKPSEVAERHRVEESTLANHRSRGEGIPFTKLPSGAVLYKLRDVLTAEQKGMHGFTWAKLNDAMVMSDLSPRQREAVKANLKKLI